MSVSENEQAYRAALEHHRDRMTGRAAQRLAGLRPRQPAAAFAGLNCVQEILHGRHVHIDPYGHIFPGTCSGVILGRAGQRTVGQVWHDLAAGWRQHPVLSTVVAGGSHELLQRAKPLGYREVPGGYASKCHLCSHIRQFLVDHGLWLDFVGPRECYATASGTEAVNGLQLPVLDDWPGEFPSSPSVSDSARTSR